MKCADLQKGLDAWVDQELDVVNAQAFAEHLSSCPACKKRVDALVALRKDVKAHATRYALPSALADKIAHMTKMEPTSSPARRRWLPVTWGATGAGLALAACLAF